MPVILALGCAIVYGIADYCGGRASRSAPSLYVGLVGQISSLMLAVVAIVILGTAVPPSRDLWWSGSAGVASAVALVSFYHALSHGAMTVVAPITAVTSAVIPVAVGLLEGERPSTLASFGMALAVVAVALVSGAVGQRHTVTQRSTIVYALIAGVGFAMIFICLSKTSEDSGVWPLVGARVVSITIIATAVLLSRTSLKGRGSIWRLAAAAGLLDTSANFLYLLAVRRGLLSVVVVVVALYPVSTVCLAFGLDRERVSKSQAVGMALALGSLVLVSVSGAT